MARTYRPYHWLFQGLASINKSSGARHERWHQTPRKYMGAKLKELRAERGVGSSKVLRRAQENAS